MKFDRKKSLEEYGKTLFKLQQTLKNYEKIENKDELRKNYGSQILTEEDLDGEIWKKFPKNPKYLVSNKGRIKYDGKIQQQTHEINPETGEPKWGYFVLEDKNLRQDYIYNFVAYTFLGKIEGDRKHVHHITNDGYYNTTDNLVLLTKDEHSYVHGFEVGGAG